MGSVAAQSADCPADSTQATCVETRRINDQTAAINTRAAAFTTEATARAALNKALFEVPNSAEIKPLLGTAKADDDTELPQQWLGLQATKFAAEQVAAKLKNDAAFVMPVMLIGASSNFQIDLAERVRLEQALLGMEQAIAAANANFEPVPPVGTGILCLGTGAPGALLQGLASIAGFFVANVEITQGANTATDKLAETALISALPGKLLLVERILKPNKALAIEREVVAVRKQLETLAKKIAVLQTKTDEPNKKRLSEAIAFQTEALSELNKIFVTPVVGVSAYAQAIKIDLAKLTGNHALEIHSELSGGVLVSKQRRFRSGSFKVLAMATLHYRLTDLTTGIVGKAGVVSAQCFWDMPTEKKSFDSGSTGCSVAK